MLLLWVSALLSGIIDNIPYVATMSPLVAELVADAETGGADPNVLWWALALGADLGGNATAIGASANVVVTRHRRPQRPPDLVLAVHPLRRRWSRSSPSRSRYRICGFATSSSDRRRR